MKVARYYENAIEGNRDYKKAVYWYRQAAEHGVEDAEKALERLKRS